MEVPDVNVVLAAIRRTSGDDFLTPQLIPGDCFALSVDSLSSKRGRSRLPHERSPAES
jgi:hypothetical protein